MQGVLLYSVHWRASNPRQAWWSSDRYAVEKVNIHHEWRETNCSCSMANIILHIVFLTIYLWFSLDWFILLCFNNLRLYHYQSVVLNCDRYPLLWFWDLWLKSLFEQMIFSTPILTLMGLDFSDQPEKMYSKWLVNSIIISFYVFILKLHFVTW